MANILCQDEIKHEIQIEIWKVRIEYFGKFLKYVTFFDFDTYMCERMVWVSKRAETISKFQYEISP